LEVPWKFLGSTGGTLERQRDDVFIARQQDAGTAGVLLP
jgi:hypothetical protein